MQMQIIPRDKFTWAFENLGWENYISENDEYIVWEWKERPDLWTVIPKNEKSGEYLKYQEQNIKLLLLSLNNAPIQENFTKIYEQLLGLHYPIISRFTSKNSNFDEGIPPEVGGTVIQTIYSNFPKFAKSSIYSREIKNLKLAHTQHGSYILKINVPIEQSLSLQTLFPNEDQTKNLVQDYLNSIEKLSKIEESNPKKYYEKFRSENIPFCLIEAFLAKKGIVDITKKYIENNSIEALFIKSENNDLLEFRNKKIDFKTIDIRELNTLDDEFIKILKDFENQFDLDEKGAEIIGTIYRISEYGKATFKAESVNRKDVKNIEKIQTTELTDEWKKKCYKAGAEDCKLKITGDLSKKPGQPAKLIVGALELYEEEKPQLKMF